MTETKVEKDLSPSPAPLSVEAKPEEEEGVLFRRRRRRRWILCCSGTSVAIILVLAIVCVILAVTVFKVRDPKVTVNSVSLDHFSFRMDILSPTFFHLNVTLDLNLSVKNPNKASFKFGNSTTQLYYRGINCGEALIPAGKVEADRTVKMNTTVTIIGDRLVSNSHLLGDALSGMFPLSTSTRIPGRVNLFNIFKHHAVSYSSCNISIAIVNRTIQSENCSHNLKL